jgi:hypothetical protein
LQDNDSSKFSYTVLLEDLSTNLVVHILLVRQKLALLEDVEKLINFGCNTGYENEPPLKVEESDLDVPIEKVNRTVPAKTLDENSQPPFQIVSEPRQPLLRPEYPKDLPGVTILESKISQVDLNFVCLIHSLIERLLISHMEVIGPF